MIHVEVGVGSGGVMYIYPVFYLWRWRPWDQNSALLLASPRGRETQLRHLSTYSGSHSCHQQVTLDSKTTDAHKLYNSKFIRTISRPRLDIHKLHSNKAIETKTQKLLLYPYEARRIPRHTPAVDLGLGKI